MKSPIFLLFCLFTISISQPTATQSVGLIINYELGSGQRLQNYIKAFHIPLCTAVSQFNIVISAEATMQMYSLQTSLKPLQKVIPIYYIFTSQGENFHFRLQAGNNSKAEFYYMSNMNNAEQGCLFLESLTNLINQKSVGGLIGLIGQQDSLSSVSADLTKLKKQFGYTRQTPQHFAMVQNIRVFPRHILQLSLSNISEIVKMRKETASDCEEIFINFVSAHFYPELRPSIQIFNSPFKSRINNQETDKKKSKCLRSYIDILGYLPLFYNRKEFTKTLWVNPNLSKIVQLKKFQLIGELQKNKQGARRFLSPTGEIIAEKHPSTDFLAHTQKESILKVLRVTLFVVFIVTLLLALQFVNLSLKEQKNIRK